MIFLVILLFNVLIPNIYSKPLNSSDVQTVNHVPWDAYEYAKNISKQLSNELLLNMNKYPGGLPDFELKIDSKTVHFYNGTADYNGNSVDSDDLIVNGTFNVKTGIHKTTIEFGPNFENFSVFYDMVYDKRPNSSQVFGIVYDQIPIVIKIVCNHDNGSIEAKIMYGSSEEDASKLSFGKDFDAYWNALEHTHASLEDINVSDLKKNVLREFSRDRAQLCNLFESDSQFLQPQLKNIVKSLPYPTQNITDHRWEEISQKINEDGLKTFFVLEYEYAVKFTKNLQSVFSLFGKVRKWPAIEVPLPAKFRSNSSEDDMLRLPIGAAEGIEFAFAYYYQKSNIKKGSFSTHTVNNTRTIRFAPSFPNYLIEYAWIVPGLNGTFGVSYKTIPIEVEVKHNIDTAETMATISYYKAPDENERVFAESRHVKKPHGNATLSPSMKANYEKLNIVLTKYYDSADIKNGAFDIFQPGSTYLQPVADIIIKVLNFPERE